MFCAVLCNCFHSDIILNFCPNYLWAMFLCLSIHNKANVFHLLDAVSISEPSLQCTACRTEARLLIALNKIMSYFQNLIFKIKTDFYRCHKLNNGYHDFPLTCLLIKIKSFYFSFLQIIHRLIKLTTMDTTISPKLVFPIKIKSFISLQIIHRSINLTDYTQQKPEK